MKNINLGLLGHVDSGKTSLAKAISITGSTASFDKHPQSQERGITVDLGFSTLQLGTQLQVTLVDCPGHSSLIRTVIGGIQIINGIILVLDASQGLQHQTNECLLLAKIFRKPVIVVLNKWDLVDQRGKEKISPLKHKIEKYLGVSEIEFVPISLKNKHGIEGLEERLFRFCLSIAEKENADNFSLLSIKNESLCGGWDSANLAGLLIKDANISESKNETFESKNVTLKSKNATLESKNATLESKNAIFMVDHVFVLKGQGTVFTGTLLIGMLSVGDEVEVMNDADLKRIKSIHVFKRPVTSIGTGDRAGLCIANTDSALISSERMLLGTPGTILRQVSWLYCSFNCIKQFKYSINSKSKFHIIIGHEVILGNVYVLTRTMEGEHQMSQTTDYRELEDNLFVVIRLDSPVSLQNPSVMKPHYVVSKLDIDLASANASPNECRFAFHGMVLLAGHQTNYSNFVKNLNIVQWKEKVGKIERIMPDGQFVLVKELAIPKQFKTPIGLQVEFASGIMGKIDSFFGQNKKLKVQVDNASSLKRESPVKLRYEKQIMHLA